MISIIVATGLNGEIGKDNALLWSIPEDMKHFVRYTTGKSVVMGRKTFESIGKPLPNRTNYVLSRSNIDIPGCIVINDVDQIKEIEGDVVIIGGAEIYKLTEEFTDEIVISKVFHFYHNADAFYFPNLDNFELTNTQNHTNFAIHTYTRVR